MDMSLFRGSTLPKTTAHVESPHVTGHLLLKGRDTDLQTGWKSSRSFMGDTHTQNENPKNCSIMKIDQQFH